MTRSSLEPTIEGPYVMCEARPSDLVDIDGLSGHKPIDDLYNDPLVEPLLKEGKPCRQVGEEIERLMLDETIKISPGRAKNWRAWVKMLKRSCGTISKGAIRMGAAAGVCLVFDLAEPANACEGPGHKPCAICGAPVVHPSAMVCSLCPFIDEGKSLPTLPPPLPPPIGFPVPPLVCPPIIPSP